MFKLSEGKTRKRMIQTFALISAAMLLGASFGACKKEKDKSPAPVPEEPELITTLDLELTREGDTLTFRYRVENGFGTTSPGTVQVDTIVVDAGRVYDVSLKVLNHKVEPVEDITEEILEESRDHLFLFLSEPATGPGSLIFSEGNKDPDGAPVNQRGILTAGAAGRGTLRLYLMHDPIDKTGTTPGQSGGETDLYAVFPVVIRE